MAWFRRAHRQESPGEYGAAALFVVVLALLTACSDSSTEPTRSTTTSTSSTSTTTSASTTTSILPTSTLYGYVQDRNLRGIVGARVEVVDGANAGKFAIADGNGYYSIPGIVAASFTLRTSLNGVFLLDVGITVTADTRRDLPVTTSSSSSSTTTTVGTSSCGGSGARVDFRTNSTTCRCTVGTINVRVDGNTCGSMNCSGSVSVNVAPGAHTFNACDNVGCFGNASATLSSGSVYTYTALCSGFTSSDKTFDTVDTSK